MIAFAISYGLLTLITLWAGAGSESAHFGARAPIALLLYVIIAATLFRLSKIPLVPKPFKLFGETKEYTAAIGILVVTVGAFLLMKMIFPIYFLAQSKAFMAMGSVGALAFALTVAGSDLIYRRFYSPSWGVASAAFLEALSWGLATQSFVAFAWIFTSGWVMSKTTRPESMWGSAVLRLVVGLAWIAIT